MLRADFDELFDAGCIQTGGESQNLPAAIKETFRKRFPGIMMLTKLDPCTTGCPAFHGGKCEAYQRFHTEAKRARAKDLADRAHRLSATRAPGTAEYVGMSVAQIAKKLNISKNEVRRRKVRGEI